MKAYQFLIFSGQKVIIFFFFLKFGHTGEENRKNELKDRINFKKWEVGESVNKRDLQETSKYRLIFVLRLLMEGVCGSSSIVQTVVLWDGVHPCLFTYAYERMGVPQLALFNLPQFYLYPKSKKFKQEGYFSIEKL